MSTAFTASMNAQQKIQRRSRTRDYRKSRMVAAAGRMTIRKGRNRENRGLMREQRTAQARRTCGEGVFIDRPLPHRFTNLSHNDDLGSRHTQKDRFRVRQLI
ncbi:hypothetical protein [Caballeronia sp. LZ034LL]|uniref:hypothetical protein n=1 Tax=Caballeronia sp. LZ034LL TaxID=3038567 RepID=UPI002861DE1B|nr:hypothetical protein [Caballeronia sp. LZ034LL]MDR5833571.1 hypothetical protein [Caballeronia sp. LZ034LL]